MEIPKSVQHHHSLTMMSIPSQLVFQIFPETASKTKTSTEVFVSEEQVEL